MTNFLWGFVIGAALLDFLWAWKFGIPQIFWTRLKFGIGKIYKVWKYRK